MSGSKCQYKWCTHNAIENANPCLPPQTDPSTYVDFYEVLGSVIEEKIKLTDETCHKQVFSSTFFRIVLILNIISWPLE